MNFNNNKIYTTSDYINAYAQLKNEGLPYGLESGLKNLDELCRLDKGRLALVTGVPSAGKSTFINYLCAVYNIRYGFKTLFYSAETNLTQHLNTFYKIFQKQGDEKFTQYVAENFMLFNENQSFYIDTLLEATENQYANIPFDVFVIDSYTTLSYSRPNNMTETEYISCVLDKLTRFARMYNVAVILIAHPRKMDRDIEGGYEEPTPYDICGSANFFNKADFCLTVHRVWEDGKPTNVTKVTANKVKTSNYGTTGSTYLGFSADYESYCDVDYRPNERAFISNDKKIGDFVIPSLNFDYKIVTNKQPQYFETELNYFKNISDVVPKLVSFKELQQLQATYADCVESIRIEKNEDKQKQMKSKLLPCIAFNARFNGNRCKNNINEYTNLLYIDIDYNDNKPHIMESLPQILEKIDQILFFQRSARGKGYMAVMPTDPIKDGEDFLAVWKAAEADFKKLGIVIDNNTKDASRVTFISYDEQSYMNPYAIPYTNRYAVVRKNKAEYGDKQSIVMPFKTGDSILSHNNKNTVIGCATDSNTSSTASNEQMLKTYIDYVAKNKVDFCKDYKDYLDVGIACLKEFGLDKTKEYFPQLCQYSSKYNYETTLADIDKWHETYDGKYKCNFGTIAYHFQKCCNNNIYSN